MRLRAEQLAQQMQQALLPVYMVFGEEQMLVEESSDVIRKHVRSQGAEDRQVWHVDSRFNWSELQWQEQTMSLFSSQRLLELRLPSGSPGKEGGEALRRYMAQPPQDTTLLIICGKIEARSQKSKWFTEVDRVGATIPVWPVDLAKLPNWISLRMQQRGLTSSSAVSSLIAERVEGNLFAAAQEIDKLQLLCPDGQVDEQIILTSVADNARFETFGLMESVYLGQVSKIPRMVSRLRSEGLDILAVFSGISWSLHRMIDMAVQLEQGIDVRTVFESQQPKIWDNKRTMTQTALARHSVAKWKSFVVEMAQIDQAAKGTLTMCPWLLLEQLCMHVARA